MPPPPIKGTFSTRDSRVTRRVVQPLKEFLALETAGGFVLIGATVVALLWANSPWPGSYDSFWHTPIGFRIGDLHVAEDLKHWVNDGLMSIFFLVVGLEIKRELVVGELSTARKAIFPVVGALGGMIVPALIYISFNAGGAGAAGWGIPMATDIAFALGILALLGKHCPSSLKIFLLSLAIVDDIGAIVVIAVFYTSSIKTGALIVAAVGLMVVLGLRSLRVYWTPIYIVVGSIVWVATLESGIHATIAGVVLGLLAPARAVGREQGVVGAEGTGLTAAMARMVQIRAQAAIPVTERLEYLLHPWTSYAIIPIFALANAGVDLSYSSLGDAASSPVAFGIVAGLVLGKLSGITLFCWVAVRLRLVSLPAGVGWQHLIGVAAIAGIGFTVSLFITELAFDAPDISAEAKVAILAASVLASALGAFILRTATVPADPTDGP